MSARPAGGLHVLRRLHARSRRTLRKVSQFGEDVEIVQVSNSRYEWPHNKMPVPSYLPEIVYTGGGISILLHIFQDLQIVNAFFSRSLLRQAQWVWQLLPPASLPNGLARCNGLASARAALSLAMAYFRPLWQGIHLANSINL